MKFFDLNCLWVLKNIFIYKKILNLFTPKQHEPVFLSRLRIPSIFFPLPFISMKLQQNSLNFNESPGFASVFDWFPLVLRVQYPNTGQNTQHSSFFHQNQLIKCQKLGKRWFLLALGVRSTQSWSKYTTHVIGLYLCLINFAIMGFIWGWGIREPKICGL